MKCSLFKEIDEFTTNQTWSVEESCSVEESSNLSFSGYKSKVFISTELNASSVDLNAIQTIFSQVEKQKDNQPETTQNQFNISIQNIQNDERTTLMIRNIPCNYTKKQLQSEIDYKFGSKYDYLYIPHDLKGGFAFINLKNKKYTIEFVTCFHNRPWNFNKSAICQLKYAKQQYCKNETKVKAINPGIYAQQSVQKIIENQIKQLKI